MLIPLLSIDFLAKAEEPDSTRWIYWTPFATTIGAGGGHVFRPRTAKKYNITFPAFQSISASLLFTSNRNTLIDTLFGKPYFGIGVYKPFFHKSELLGDPASFYIIYGLNIYQLSDELTLSAEAKLGTSIGWNPYDSTTNHENRIIGAKNNYHAGIDIFLTYRINSYLQMRAGATYSHVSDGAYRLPNAGLNTIGGFADVIVTFKDRLRLDKHTKAARKVKPHIEYDLDVSCSSRQILGEVENTNSTVILNHSFKAVDLSTYAMYVRSRYLRMGVGIHLIYDESSNITATRTINEETATFVNSYEPSNSRERFAAGVFGKVEFPMGYVNGVVDYGYIFTPQLNSNNFTRANLGLKSYLYKGINASFGIQFTPKNKANCVFLGIGYTFNYYSLFR